MNTLILKIGEHYKDIMQSFYNSQTREGSKSDISTSANRMSQI